MDIQNTLNQHITIPNPTVAGPNPQKPLPSLTSPGSSEQAPENQAASGQGTPVSGEFAELEASLEKIRAGEAILDAAVAKEAESAKAQKQQDRAELDTTKDTEYAGSSRDVASERINQKLAELRDFTYNSRLSVNENYNQIQSTFQSLLNEILSDYTGSLQLELMSQLDAFALNAIKQLISQQFQELLDFFVQYGRPSSGEALMNGLFENMANRKPLSFQSQAASGNSAFGGTGYAAQNGQEKGSGQKLTQGIIYQRDAKARINTQYQTNVGRSERSENRLAQVLKQGGYLSGGKTFTLRDVRQAQTFVQYLNENLSQMKSEKLPYTSEEYLGFSAGVSSLKAQTFIDQTGLGEGTASALKYAMGTFAQEYFFQNAQALKETPEFRNQSSTPAYQADSFQKIYRYMVDSYNENHDAQSSALLGLKKSLESYYEKQSDPVYQNMNRYRSDIGFFSRSPVDNVKEEILNGWKAICRDWNIFLQKTQLSRDKAIRFDYTLSRNYYAPFLISHEKSSPNGKFRKKRAVQFALRLGILLIGIIVCLFLLALFS